MNKLVTGFCSQRIKKIFWLKILPLVFGIVFVISGNIFYMLLLVTVCSCMVFGVATVSYFWFVNLLALFQTIQVGSEYQAVVPDGLCTDTSSQCMYIICLVHFMSVAVGNEYSFCNYLTFETLKIIVMMTMMMMKSMYGIDISVCISRDSAVWHLITHSFVLHNWISDGYSILIVTCPVEKFQLRKWVIILYFVAYEGVDHLLWDPELLADDLGVYNVCYFASGIED